MRHKVAQTKGVLHWGQRLVIDEPIDTGIDLIKFYQVPYTGTPDRHLIEKNLRKSAPVRFFGLTYEVNVLKVDREASVVSVQIIHTKLED